jgi:hypothetical protein
MKWLYHQRDKTIGPISESTLHELLACGAIQRETQVCQEGEANWIAFQQAFPEENCHPKIIQEITQVNEPGPRAQPTFSSNLKKKAQVGLQGAKQHSKNGVAHVKRHARQLALKTQVEKLKRIDLREAHYELGKKCFESSILAEELPREFQAIRDLDATIAEKRKTEEAEEEETKMATLKRMGKHAAKSSHAQALTLKRQQLVTQLGQSACTHKGSSSLAGLKLETEAVGSIEAKIQSKAKEAKTLGDQNVGGPKIRIVILAMATCAALFFIFQTTTTLDKEESPSSPSIDATPSIHVKQTRAASPGAFALYMQGYNDPRQGEVAAMMSNRFGEDDQKAIALIVLGAQDRNAGNSIRFHRDTSIIDPD